MIAVIAAFSQLFVDSNPSEIAIARTNNICDRQNRDYTRDEILLLLENHLVDKKIDKETFEIEAIRLLSIYQDKADKSNEAFAILNETKARYKFSGFDNLNTFLANFGVYLFGSIMSLLIYLFSVHLLREKYSSSGKSLKFVSQTMFIVFFTYLTWSIHPINDFDRSVYVIALLITSCFAYKGISLFVKNNFFLHNHLQYEKLRNGITRLFDVLIIEVNDKFVNEDQKKEYIKFYGKEISNIEEIVK